MGDARVSPAAISAVEGALREHGQKQVVDAATATVAGEAASAARDGVYSLDELVAATKEHRDRSSGDGTVALHVLVLPGRFEAEGIPGVAFHATAFAVFPEVIAGMLPSGAEVDQFEAAIAVHELGHTFGLVNVTGVGGFHESADHPRHSPDEDSVMYWAIESSSMAEVFRTGPPSNFNPDDVKEMDRIRGQQP